MRVGNNKDLKLLIIPLIAGVGDLPPLLPRAAVDVQELDPIVEIPGGDVDGGGGEIAAVEGGGRVG